MKDKKTKSKQRRFSLKMKFLVITLAPLIVFASVSIYLTVQDTQININREKQNTLKSMVDISCSVFAYYYNLSYHGEMSESDAKNASLNTIRSYRFGDRSLDYFWVQENRGGTPYIVVHPFRPDLENTDVSGIVDTQGKHIFVEFQTVAEANPEGGFVDYTWQYYDEVGKIAPKKSFVIEYSNWSYIVGTGIYTDDVNQIVQESVLNSLFVIVIIFTLSIVCIIVAITRFISKPLQKLSNGANLIADGDLRVDFEIKSSDEVGDLAKSFTKMQTTLTNLISKNKSMSTQLSVAAEELSSSSEEISSSSENIASSQQQISKGAANQVISITEVQKKIVDLTQGIKEVKKRVDDIGKISDLISNIANQTNMLALNAAIEAARAGEAGRGFNVVADQVRKLADESKRAVIQTNDMLNEIQAITQKQESNSIEIVKNVDSVATVAEETSASTEEAAAAAEEQVSSMEMITSTAQQLLQFAENISNEFKMIKIKEEIELNLEKEKREAEVKKTNAINALEIEKLNKLNKTKTEKTLFPVKKSFNSRDPSNEEIHPDTGTTPNATENKLQTTNEVIESEKTKSTIPYKEHSNVKNDKDNAF